MTSHNAILVANSAVARLFDRRSLKEPWVETQDWWHGESRMQARDLAEGLKHALAMDSWHELEIFASAPFLGDLLAHLTPEVKKTVRSTHTLDWTALSVQEIEKRWLQEFKV